MSGVTDDLVALGVELLANAEDEELSLADAVTRLETVTTNPTVTRRILDTAEKRGIIHRENGILDVRSGGFVRFQSQVITKEGEFSCRRCGASITTGHFIRFEAGELGPFGSSCVRKVTGRE